MTLIVFCTVTEIHLKRFILDLGLDELHCWFLYIDWTPKHINWKVRCMHILPAREFSWLGVVAHQGHFAAKSWVGAQSRGRWAEAAWRYLNLSEMLKGRDHPPRMLLLAGGDRKRVLVAGGYSSTIEVLQISFSNPSDWGHWTRIVPVSKELYFTILASITPPCSNYS